MKFLLDRYSWGIEDRYLYVKDKEHKSDMLYFPLVQLIWFTTNPDFIDEHVKPNLDYVDKDNVQ